MFLRSTDIDGLHGYHHSNRLDMLSTKETNFSKNDPLLTTKFEDFQDLLVWRLSEPFFFSVGTYIFEISGHVFEKTGPLFIGREFPSSTQQKKNTAYHCVYHIIAFNTQPNNTTT